MALNSLPRFMVTTTNPEELFGAGESALEMEICNLRYRMEYSRIFEKVPYVAERTSTAVNDGDEEASIEVSITYEDEGSYSFSSSSLTRVPVGVGTGRVSVGVGTGNDPIGTRTIDVLGIKDDEVIEPVNAVEGSLEWGETAVVRESVTVSGVVCVPARSVTVVSYAGMRGSCCVPFDYTRKDKSCGGEVVETEQVDGIFNGVNYYGFRFEILQTQPI